MNTHILAAAVAATLASGLTLSLHRALAAEPPPVTLPSRDPAPDAELRGALRRVEQRLDALETVERRAPLVVSESVKASSAAAAQQDEATQTQEAAFGAELRKMVRASASGEASEEEQARFWEAARKGKAVDQWIQRLRNSVKESPNDAELRMDLADAYVAKLLTVPFGPERGVWGVKAERQWSEALDIDPDHWEAQYSLAYNHSMYPEFLGKTDDAILGFQRAVEIQKRQPHDEKFAQAYLGLARMYERKGRLKDAIATLTEAAGVHTRDARVQAELDRLRDEAERKEKQ